MENNTTPSPLFRPNCNNDESLIQCSNKEGNVEIIDANDDEPPPPLPQRQRKSEPQSLTTSEKRFARTHFKSLKLKPTSKKAKKEYGFNTPVQEKRRSNSIS